MYVIFLNHFSKSDGRRRANDAPYTPCLGLIYYNMHEKCGHSMDNGFIFKKSKWKLEYEREKKILGAVYDLPAQSIRPNSI